MSYNEVYSKDPVWLPLLRDPRAVSISVDLNIVFVRLQYSQVS